MAKWKEILGTLCLAVMHHRVANLGLKEFDTFYVPAECELPVYQDDIISMWIVVIRGIVKPWKPRFHQMLFIGMLLCDKHCTAPISIHNPAPVTFITN